MRQFTPDEDLLRAKKFLALLFIFLIVLLFFGWLDFDK